MTNVVYFSINSRAFCLWLFREFLERNADGPCVLVALFRQVIKTAPHTRIVLNVEHLYN